MLQATNLIGFGGAPAAAAGGGPFTFEDLTSENGNESNTCTISYPTTVNSGDLLLCQVGIDGGAVTFTKPTGWTLEDDQGGVGGSPGILFSKVATGSESGTFSLTHTGSIEQWASLIFRFSGHTGFEHAVSSAITGFIDPPGLTPSEGLQEYFWIVTSCNDADALTLVTTGYDAGAKTYEGNIKMAYLYKTDTISSLNPGNDVNFQIDGDSYVSYTIAVW